MCTGSLYHCRRCVELSAAPSFTVPVAKFFKHKVETNFLHKAQMENRFVKLSEPVEEKKIKVEDGSRKRRIGSARSPSIRWTYSTTRKRSLRRAVIIHLLTSRIPAATLVVLRRGGAVAIAVVDTINSQHVRLVNKTFPYQANTSRYRVKRGTRGL